MDCKTGQVVGLRGELAVVTTESTRSCEGCQMRDGCGRVLSQRVEVLNPAGAVVGDTVSLDIAPRGLLAISALLYLFPALSAIVGAALGAQLGPALGLNPDVSAVLLLLLLLGVSFVTLRLLHPRLAGQRALRVTITEVVARAGDTTVEG